jgi:hypothetical protein
MRPTSLLDDAPRSRARQMLRVAPGRRCSSDSTTTAFAHSGHCRTLIRSRDYEGGLRQRVSLPGYLPCRRLARTLVCVTVGQYAGMPLQDAADTLRHGGIFLLRKPPITDAEVSLNGWTTQVKKAAKAVVTFGPATAANAANAAGTYKAAIKAANDGLDYLSVRGEADVMIQTDRDQSILWWPQSAGVIMQATTVETVGFAGFAVGMVVRGADGNVKPSPPLTPIQHHAFRFIRMSRTSTYLYDSYRNMFLALECLLNDIAPQRSESEGVWFHRALGVANSLVPAGELAPENERDPVKWVYDNMYRDERSALSHAKRNYLLPQDETERDGLAKSLEKLSNYVHRLVEVHLGVQHLRSQLSVYSRRKMAEAVLLQQKFYVSDDESPFNEDDENATAAPAAGAVVLEAVPSELVMVDQYLGIASVSWNASALTAITAICRTGACKDGGPVGIVSDLRGPLELGDSVTRYELRIGIRVTDAQAPPQHFVA